MDRLAAMEVFVKVVETGSLSRAAEHLGMANASVTTCLRNLETYLGVTLIRRNTRHMKMTEEGAAYYARCRDLLAQVEDIEASVAPSRVDLRGTLRIEIPVALGRLILAPALPEFASRHPGLQISVSFSNTVESLIQAGVDVAIRMDAVDDGDLIARWVFEDAHVLCASRQWLAQVGMPASPRDLAPSQCLGYIPSLMGRPRMWIFARNGEQVEIAPASNLQFNSSDALLHCAACGGGFVYVLRVFAQGYLDRGELVQVLPDWSTAKQTFYAVYRQSRFIAPKIHAFLEFLCHTVFNQPPSRDSILVPQIMSRRLMG